MDSVSEVTGPGEVETGSSPARETVEKMIEAGLLDELMARVDEGGLALTGAGGFLPELTRRVLEAGLQAELTEHLGYEKHDPAGRGSPNSRNGSMPKTVASEIGEFDLNTPRHRVGSFEPRLVPKVSRRIGGLSEMIISLYAGGMTIRDIRPIWSGPWAPSCPTSGFQRSPMRCSRMSRLGRPARCRRSTRSSTSTRWW